MINFSTGSYLEVVIPTVTEWIAAVGKPIKDDVIIEEVIPSFDKKNKHVETIIRFRVKNNKITVTAYYTTQRIKVEGRGYLDFGKNFLIPIFNNKIVNSPIGKIEQYNKDVIAALSGKRKLISRPVRSVKYKAIAKIPCAKCDITFPNNSQLNKHKREMHTKTGDDSSWSIKIPAADNISLLDITNEYTENTEVKQITVEESCPLPENTHKIIAEITHIEPPRTPFRCDKCEYSTLNENDVRGHKLSKHQDENTELMKQLPNNSPIDSIQELTCSDCDSDVVNYEDLQEHKTIHKNDKEKINTCDSSSHHGTDLQVHNHKAHESQKVETQSNQIEAEEISLNQSTYICGECGKNFDTRNNCNTHMMNEHKSICRFCSAEFYDILQLE